MRVQTGNDYIYTLSIPYDQLVILAEAEDDMSYMTNKLIEDRRGLQLNTEKQCTWCVLRTQEKNKNYRNW